MAIGLVRAGRSSRSRRPAWGRRCRGATAAPHPDLDDRLGLGVGAGGASAQPARCRVAGRAQERRPAANTASLDARDCWQAKAPAPPGKRSLTVADRIGAVFAVQWSEDSRRQSPSADSSMPVEKLRAVDQRPGQVDRWLRAVFGVAGLGIGLARSASSSSVGKRERIVRYKLVDDRRAASWRCDQVLKLGPLFDLPLDVAASSAGAAACAAVRRLLRSDSRPVSRGGRPNSLQERAGDAAVGQGDRALVLGDEGERLGNGAGVLLVVPVIWQRASISTSASSRRSG